MARPNPKSASKATSALRHWYSPEVIPIWIMIGGASLGAAWYLTRLARSPDVIWDKKNNPTPWNNVEQGTNTKLINLNKEHLAKEYSRDRL